jgi:hypothetical protein
MTEEPDQSRRPGEDDEGPGIGEDGGGRGKVRTAGETSVDEALGAGDEPAR